MIAAVLLAGAIAAEPFERIRVTGQPPVATQVMERSQIERLQATSLVPLLQQIAGLDVVQTGGLSGEVNLYMQGSNSSQVLVLLDGQPLRSATLGTASLQHIHPADIERIEIIRGARSSVYGASAMGGVINLISRSATSNRAHASARYGTNHYRELNVGGAYHGEHYGFQAQVGRRLERGIDQTTDLEFGNSQSDSYAATSVLFNGSLEPSEGVRFAARHQYNDSRAQYDTDCLTEENFERVFCLPFIDAQQEATRLSLSAELSPMVTHHWSIGRYQEEALTRDDAAEMQPWQGLNSYFQTNSESFNWQQDLLLAGTTQQLTTGLDYHRDRVKAGDFSYDNESRRRLALFNQYAWAYAGWDTAVALRLENDQQFGTELLYSADMVWQLTRDVRAGFNYGNGFRAPTFNDLYWPGSGNPDLRPETSQNIQGFVHFDTGLGHLEAQVFYQTFDDLIAWAPTEEDAYIWLPFNINEARTQGVTLRWQHRWQQWRVDAHATYLDAEDRETGQPLVNRARRHGTVTLNRAFNDAMFSMDIQGSSGRPMNAANSERTGGYVLLNLRWRQQFADNWDWQISLNNFFDRQYQLRSGYNQPGRELRLGFTWRH